MSETFRIRYPELFEHHTPRVNDTRMMHLLGEISSQKVRTIWSTVSNTVSNTIQSIVRSIVRNIVRNIIRNIIRNTIRDTAENTV